MNEIKSNPMYRYLVVLTVCCVFGLHAWHTLFNNFAVEAAGLEGNHIGAIQSIREVPGFLALLIVFVLLVIKEHRLAAISIFILGLGIAATGVFPTFIGLLITTTAMSFGFHYFEAASQSLTLQYFDEKKSPLVFGRLKSLSAASSIGVGFIIFLITKNLDFSYSHIYIGIGIIVMAAGIWGLFFDPTSKDIAPQHKKLIFKKRYWLFYVLIFLSGARRQIFLTFATFLLVKKLGFSIQTIALIYTLNNFINYFFSPMAGKAIVRFGEKKILTLEYIGLVLVFSAYAMTESRVLLVMLYILDNIFFNFSMAIRTYFQKVADPRDIAPSMAAGITISHIAAVVLPVLGGILWMVDYRIPFIIGACLGVVSLIATQWVRVPQR